jgi:predicted AAA+ superfamily ATPase
VLIVVESGNDSNAILIKRNIEELAQETVSDTPVTVIQGARQVGKSTLAKILASSLDSRQLTFDNTTVLQAAKEDPLGFVEQYRRGTLVIDEVQLYPQILRSIKLSVDEDRRPARFIITGSADLLHITGANESLAGRAETIRLFPFSQGELQGYREDFVKAALSSDVHAFHNQANLVTREDYAATITRGGYPEAVCREGRRRRAFFKNYLVGVVDHDAVELSGLAHLEKLSLLFSLLSAQTTTELVKANLAKLVQIPETSITSYIRLLQDLCLISELPAWGRSMTKRAIGRSKITLNDTGVASYLNGMSEASLAEITHGEMFGQLLENLVVSELLKQQAWSEIEYSLFHYRDKDQREVDIVVELNDGRVLGIEVKATQSVSRKHFSGLRYLRDTLSERFVLGIVLYTGQESLSYGDRLAALPLCSVWEDPKQM